MRPNGISLGRPFGIPVYLGFSSLFLLVLVALIGRDIAPRHFFTGEYAIQPMQYGLMLAAALLISLLLHELAHCLAARRFKIPVVRIQFEGFGGNSQFSQAARTPGAEAGISVAGPLANLVIYAIAAIVEHQQTHATTTGYFAFDVARMNLLLAVFNLLPGLPLDGGRVLAAGMWKLLGDRVKGVRTAGYAGMVVAVGIGVYAISNKDGGQGWVLYSLLIAVSLFTGARQAVRGAQVGEAIEALRARDLVRPTYYADGELPLAEGLRRAQEAGARSIAVVDGDGAPIALMSPPAVDAVPEQRRPWVTLSSVSRSISDGDVVNAELEGDALIAALRGSESSEHLVVDADGSILGVLSTIDVVARLNKAAR